MNSHHGNEKYFLPFLSIVYSPSPWIETDIYLLMYPQFEACNFVIFVIEYCGIGMR